VLFHDNGVPVVAVEGDAAALPALNRLLKVGVADGADVKVLERALVDLGFDTGKAVTVDDHFDTATAAAVAAWQTSLGVTPTDPVAVPKGSFVVVPSGMVIGTPVIADGATLASDAVVLSLTEPAREVTTTAPVGDETFVLGATIEVEFPDGTRKNGTVVEVGTTATNTSNTPGATPSVPITLRVDGIPSSVDSFVQVPVTLRVVAEQAKNALVVPVSALVALAEGGYAVEVVDSTNADGSFASHLVGVTTGLFADGFVAVTGDQLKAGLTVVIPS
jgi:peptidoglycan hydrolase-like protein with peptidoglycan-binding domain